MRNFLYFIAFFLVLVFSPTLTRATHIMGGEITWECASNGEYDFTIIIYRDCSGFAVSPRGHLYIHNYPNANQVRQLATDQQYSSNVGDTIKPDCNVGGVPQIICGNGQGDPRAVFRNIVKVNGVQLNGRPPAAGWILTYSDFARNPIANIVGQPGITLRAKMFDHSGTVAGECVDNSPNFREKAVSLLCTGSEFTYNHNAADAELDSLIYDWARPINRLIPSNGFALPPLFVEGTTPANVTFSTGYSFTSPFPSTTQNPGNEAAVLDRNTGEITLKSLTSGKFVSVIKVTAYKCGERVAEIYRELQSNMDANCAVNNNEPSVVPPFKDTAGNFTLFTDTVNAGDLVEFNINSTDLDFRIDTISIGPPLVTQIVFDSVTIDVSGLQFGENFTSDSTGCPNPPCATLTKTVPFTGQSGGQVSFRWQTDCNHVAFSDGCVSLNNTYTFVVRASDNSCPIPAQNIGTVSVVVLADSVLLSPLINCASVQSNGDVDLDWNITPNVGNSFSAWMIYSATSETGPFTLVDSVKTYTQSTYTHIGAKADSTRRWYFVRSRSGCKGIIQNVVRDTVSTIFVDVQVQTADLNVSWNALSTPNPAGSSADYEVYREYPLGTGFSLYETTSNTSLLDTITSCIDSVRYRVELVNNTESCTSVSNVKQANFEFDKPLVDFSFTNNVCPNSSVSFTNLTTSPGGAALTYVWDFGDATPTSTQTNPSHTYTAVGTYNVELTATLPNGCDSSLTQTINVDLPSADAGSDVSICSGVTTTIGGSPTTTALNPTYAWSNSGTLSSASVANPDATPLVTTTYIVTVTDANNCTNTDQVTVTVNSLPTADAGTNQTICEGDNVSIGGSPTGPVGATYTWDNSGTLTNASIANPVANPTVTTTYSVTVTTGINCSDIDQVTVTVNPAPNADAGADQSICNGSSVTIGGSPTGPVGATIAWDNAGSLNNASIANPVANPTVTTTYTVTVTDGNLCTSTDQVTVTVNPLPTADAGADAGICLGSNTTIGGSPTGPVGSSFAWNNGGSLSNATAANPVANPTLTTTYTVTVTDGNLCTSTDQVTVTVNTLPTADAGTDQTICEGDNVSIGGSPTGPGGATFAWDNGGSLSSATAANPTANPTVTTTYTVTVTNGISCSAVDQVTITVNPAPNADAGADQNICGGGSVSIGGSPTGQVGATIAWDNGGSLSNASIANPSANPTVTTTYTVTVTDGNLCTSTDQVTVTVNPLPTADAGTDQTICEGDNVSIGGSPTGPVGASFSWDNGGSLSSATAANPTANPTTTTTYTVTVTDGNNCSSTDQVTITVNPSPNVDAGSDQTICNGGSVTIGGSPTGPVGATIAWDNAGSLNNASIANPVANPTVTTTYTVTVTDGNLCTSTDQVTITVNPLPTADAGADAGICLGSNTTIGGSPTGPVGSSFAWNNGGSLSSATAANPVANPTLTTTYTVTVTDGNLCTSTDQITVTVNTLPTADAGTDQTICEGDNVSIGGSPTGPAGTTFAWDNGGSLSSATAANPTANPTVTTTYTVTVTNGISCSAVDQVTITVNSAPNVDAGSDQSICDGGSVTIGGSPTSSTPGVSFAWDNGGSLISATAANPTANPTVTTTYTVTVTDGNLCTSTDQVTVTVNPLPTADAGADQTICDGDNVSIGGTPTGPVGATFAWNNAGSLNNASASNPVASPTVTTTYTVTVTDGNNCSSIDQVTLTVNPAPAVNAGTDRTICEGDNAVIGGTPTGPVGSSFIWSNSGSLSSAIAANPIANPTLTTTYTVTVTDGNLCTSTDQVTITVNPAPNVDAGADQSICDGESITIGGSPTSSTPGATFAWDNGGSLTSSIIANPVANPTITTTYTVTVTDGNLCTSTDQVIVTVNPLPTADAGIDQTICEGDNISIGGSPTGPAGTSFAWNNGGSLSSATAANPTANPTVTTTYTVTVTDGNNCSSTDQVTITVNPAPNVDAGSDQSICDGGSVTIGGSPTSSTPGTSFAWDNGGSLSNALIANPVANPTITTTYTVTVTDGNLCTSTDQVTVTVNPLPTADAGADQTICDGDNVSIGGSPTGPAGASFAWDNGGSLSNASIANPVANPTLTTTYTVTVTDGNLCTSTDQVTVTVNPLPTADAGTDQTICEGDNVGIGGSPTGPAGTTFAWDNGGSLSSATAANPIANPTVTTTYTVTVTDGNNCSSTDQVTITVNPAPNVDAGSDQTICNGDNVTIGGSPTSSTPGTSFAWDNGGSLSNALIANPVANPTVTITYTVTVTDGNLCTSTDQVTVTVNLLPTADAGADQTICEGDNVSIGGSPTGPVGATFAWDNGGSLSSATAANPTANPTVTTTYTVTVTDGNNCSSTDQVTITVNPAPNVDAGSDQTICNGDNVTIGGSPTSSTPGTSFAWDNGGSLNNASAANPVANPTVTTTYTVTVTDGNLCTSTDQVTVTVNPLPIADAGADQTICDGDNVSIGGSPTGPVGATFAWDNGGSLSSATAANPTASPTVTTTYTVTVTDGNNCSSTDQVTVTVNPLPTADAGADQTICERDNVSIGGSPTGPVGSTFAWDNGGSLSSTSVANPTANPTVTTTYTVTVTDGNNCSSTDQVTITVNPAPNVDAGSDQTICNGDNVTIGGSPTSSTPGTSFAWDNGGSLSNALIANPVANPTVTTTYTVTVTDGNLCTSTDQVTVTVNPLPTADAGADQTICEGDNVSVGGSPTGPTGATYTWDNGGSLSSTAIANPIASPTATTTYTVTVTDGNNCSSTDQVTVTVNPLPTADAGTDQTICEGDNVSIGGSPTGPVGATFAWDNGGSLSSATAANPTANPTLTTTYTVTVTDGNNCSSTDQVTVTVNPLPAADAGLDQSICIGDNVSIGGSPTGPVGATFAWDNGGSLSNALIANPLASPTVTTTYTVTVTDGNLCTSTDQVTVTVNPLPTADAGTDQTICEGDNVSIGGSPTGPVGATFAWDNSGSLSSTTASNPIANPTLTTTYTVTVTDGNNCSSTDQVTVTVNPLPTADAGVDQTICEGDNVGIGGTPTGPAGATFAWDNVGSLSNALDANPTANPIVTTTYTVTVTNINSCTSTDQVTVVVNPLPVADAGPDRTICNGRTVSIGGSPTGPPGATFVWDNASSLNDASLANPFAKPTATTSYSVTVTDVNGCTAIDEVTVIVNPAPDVDAGNDFTICNKDTVTLGGSPTSSTDGVSYKWDNSTSLDSDTDSNPQAFPTDTTTYTVTVTDPVGCSSVDFITVNVNPVPSVDFEVDALCEGDFTAFTDKTLLNNAVIVDRIWNFGDGIGTSSLQNPGYQYANSGTYDVRLLVLTADGCVDSAVKSITVLPLPLADAGEDIAICFGDTIILGGNPTGDIGTQFNWSPASDLSDVTVANPLAYPLFSTEYALSVTDLNGCFNHDTINVTVNSLPNIQAEGDTSVCVGDEVKLSATGAQTYSWTPDEWLDNSLISNPIANPLKSVRYIVTGTDLNGCMDTASVLLDVFNVEFDPQNLEICQGDSVQLKPIVGGDDSGISYFWTPGANLSSQTDKSPYTVSRIDERFLLEITNDKGCSDVDSVFITVLDSAAVDFEIINSPRCDGSVLEIVNLSTLANTYEWQLNGQFVSNERHPVIPIDHRIENTVTLIGSNTNCTNEISKVVAPGSFVQLLNFRNANVFTPNGDGINDVFNPGFEGKFIDCFEFIIYDRWGKEVFNSEVGQYGWDGITPRGQKAPTGVYYYVIKIAGEEYKGSVFLTR